MNDFLQTTLAYLKGIGPKKGSLLVQELNIYTWGDLLSYYPFRYENRTIFHQIKDIHNDLPFVQLRGTIRHIKLVNTGKKRLTAYLHDETGQIELVWFQKISWVLKQIKPGIQYIVFGKPTIFHNQYSLVHPELSLPNIQQTIQHPIVPVYHTTEKLKKHYLDSKGMAKLQYSALQQLPTTMPEVLPDYLKQRYQLLDRKLALSNIHFPTNYETLQRACLRLKFEELFYIQVQLLQLKKIRLDKQPGQILQDVTLVQRFYHDSLAFPLTGAQKRVVKEIYQDLRSGRQMNRLLQGDVSSGKTVVAFLSMLITLSNGAQVAMMAPTEILAEQHYQKLTEYAAKLDIRLALLTGSTRAKLRKQILAELKQGSIQILIGTHSLVNDTVDFKNLGLAIIDEQHRFGVLQRGKLWQKNQDYLPHVLVMSATPIPRTLAMSLYGDLDVSIIDELPAGRKPIKTMHYYDAQRLKVFKFLKDQLEKGSQAYIIYPLIEESEKLDYKNLLDGYESICRAFPGLPIGIIHGKMRPADKDYEMQRFAKGETKVMVATTVIEVGINVPNASIIVIENAERFGLAQLHQLRGRVGRGQDQSYCILMTDYKLAQKSQERIQTLVRTNDGFEIAEADLRLRGPGDLMGIQQSGLLNLKIADLKKDGKILQAAREAAKELMQQDPELRLPQHVAIRQQLDRIHNQVANLGSIS
jgi:ATP-dependent DNA helicase RecG